MRTVFVAASLSIASACAAQTFDYTTPVSWPDHPQLHTVPPAFGEASAVTILDERSTEFRKDGNEFAVFEAFHKIVHIRDDKGIEMFNKMYLPIREGSEVTNIRARTILSSGKVIDVTPDKIKSTEEDGAQYRQFAMDGVEKGSEVEYYYEEKRPFYLFGSEFFQSGEVPCLRARYLLISPAGMKFSAKGYNGFAVSPDSVIGDKRVIAGAEDNIRDLPEEKYSFRDQYLARVDFKLSYNMGNAASVRLYTWKDLGKRAYDFYTTRTDKDDKALDGFIGKIPAAPDTSLGGRISYLEDYVKTHIDIDKKLTGSGGDLLPQILNTHTANDEGVIRLFAALFDKMGIPFELVLASDRGGIPLDPELEDWDRAENVLLFFPGTGAYLDPTQDATRYPLIRPTMAGGRGLFLKTLSLGSYTTALATFGMVPIAPWDSSGLNMEADLRFSTGLDTLLVHGRQIMTGYGAAEYRPIYTFLPKDKQDEANKDIVKSIGNSADVSNINVSHSAMTEAFHNTPLVIEADIRCPDLIENAGSRLLVKIGEVIGTQTEMYQERPRQLPAEMPFPHEENRTITLHVPDGYTVRNLKDLAMDVSFPNMGFTSTYAQNGSDVTVSIRETYKSIRYPLEEFEHFKKVINASADFNKVVLVLEKP
ncbi:DUF3857 domain-containing protein [Dinghuibacter silviterrae]|uniref:Uncharacterized protein DUF3857 n=1 Tax=Dinghuibacter silviterrae TaxID=1539049 RepID=A0A4V3GM18_9BACT|nr:DUF3857 domain-containing protein [Dinghuibacter silviterrae]TDX01723.1 uncharacterized protein DUF3857 [Dinghuibacter silviterrae]